MMMILILKKNLTTADIERKREGDKYLILVSKLSVSRSNITSESRREQSKLHTIAVLGCLCCEMEILLLSGTKQQELHFAAL